MKRLLVAWILLPMFGCGLVSSGDQLYLPREMESLKVRIMQVAESATCSDGTEWGVVAFGSKPCGGPWSYLAYPKGVGEREFLDMVTRYNELERESNIKNKAVSDCALIIEPSGVRCENGVPVFIYEEF